MTGTIENLPHEKLELFSGSPPERSEPILGVFPELSDPIDMVLSLRSTHLFPDDYMVALKTKRSIRLPVRGVVKTPRFDVITDQLDALFPIPSWNREDLHPPIALQNSQDNDIVCSTPTPLPPLNPAKRDLVALDRPIIIGQPQFFLLRSTRSRQTIELLGRWPAPRTAADTPARPRRTVPASVVSWHTTDDWFSIACYTCIDVRKIFT